jgi:hypothetical protein
MGKGRGDKACLRVITPKCSEKVRKQQQVVSWIDEVEKRTTSVIDVHDRFIIGASNKDGSWGGIECRQEKLGLIVSIHLRTVYIAKRKQIN